MIGALALAAACRAIETILPGAVAAHESALLDRLTTGLDRVAGVTVLRLWSDVEDHVGLVSFTVDGFASELVAQYLSAEHGIGVRDGRFCAHPLLARLTGSDSTTAVRASLGLGSCAADVDALIDALHQLRADGARWTYAEPADGCVPLPDPRALPEWADRAPTASPCRDE